MMTQLCTLLARRGGNNDAANQWLDEHPMVLGSIALLIGIALLAYGLYALKSGTTRDKYGNELSGGTAMAMSIIRLVAGVGCCGFGLYKMFAG